MSCVLCAAQASGTKCHRRTELLLASRGETTESSGKFPFHSVQ